MSKKPSEQGQGAAGQGKPEQGAGEEEPDKLTETFPPGAEKRLKKELKENPRARDALREKKRQARERSVGSKPAELGLFVRHDTQIELSIFLGMLRREMEHGVMLREHDLEHFVPGLHELPYYEKTRQDLTKALPKILAEAAALSDLSVEDDDPQGEAASRSYQAMHVLSCMAAGVLAMFDVFRETFWRLEDVPETLPSEEPQPPTESPEEPPGETPEPPTEPPTEPTG